MGTILSFINLKGGVGKTTCCLNIAGTLSHMGKKVLTVDVDAQANLSMALLGPTRYQELVVERDNNGCRYTVYQAFLDAIRMTNTF